MGSPNYQRNMKKPIICGFLFSLLVQTEVAEAASCNLVPPMSSAAGQDIGFIIIPGAQISGEKYQDLGEEIQRQLPGARVWLGLTRGWLGNFPNPIEIAGAINDCLAGPVFIAGHSLGGVMLETYIKDHPDVAEGIIL